MTASRAREQAYPSSPPDRGGGHPSESDVRPSDGRHSAPRLPAIFRGNCAAAVLTALAMAMSLQATAATIDARQFCERSPLVRTGILEAVPGARATCEPGDPDAVPPVPARYETTLTDAQLASIRYLYLAAHTSHSAPIMFLQQFMPGDLDGLTGVRRLNVSHNGFLEHALPGAPRWFLAQLEVLYIPNMALNRITDADFFEGLTNLRELDVQRNNLTYELPGNPNRPEPTAVGPLINPEAWSRLPNLRKLKIGSNRILTLPRGFFRHLTRLEELDMFDMWYEYHPYGFGSQALPAGIFEGLRRLRKLDLGYNAIGAAPVDDGLFDGLSAIREIDLTRNPLLRRLPRGVLDLPEGVVIRTDPGVLWPDEPSENQAATGLPRIIGSARIGETLSVDLSGIEDENGLPTTFRYQWKKNSESIPGARGPTFTVTADEVTAKLRVTVSFTDGDGNAETVTSIETLPVRPAPVNTPPTGLPSISGTAHVGETLTASASGIADADGLSGATFAYQWTRSDGTTDTDIADATQASYTLVSADQGKAIKVRATFIDDGGAEEALTSAATAVVKDSLSLSVADTQVQEGAGATADFTVTLNRAASQTVTVDWTTVDGTAAAGEDYTAASGTLTFGPGQTSKTVSVVILDDTAEDSGETFTLQLGNASGATLADAEATGTISDEESPVVSTLRIDGVPQVGNTLRVSFDERRATKRRAARAEPPSGALAYQWLRGSEEIAGATASTHVLTVADVGARLAVRVESGDGSIANAATAPVWPPPANPPLADGEEELLSATVTLGSHRFPFWVAGYGRVLGESFGEMDVVSFEDGGATYAVDAFLVNSRGVFGLATGSTLPDASGLVAYWNGYRISGLEASTVKRGKLPMLAGRTPQPSSEYSRYEDGASDGVRVAVSLRRVRAAAQEALTAEFQGLPEAHDGESAFRFRVAFSEDIGISLRSLREDAFTVTGGRVTRGRRVDRRKDLFEITVEPDGAGKVTISLPAGRECGVSGAICTKGKNRRKLTNTPTASVAGPEAAPDAPRNLTISVPDDREGVLEVSWEAPGNDGGSALTGYKVQWRSGSEDYDGAAASTRQAVVTDLTGLTHTITGLTNGVACTVRIIATNGVGDGAATAGVTGTPRDRVRPELAAAAVDGDTLTLTWNEALDEGSTPPTHAFDVLVGGALREVTEVSVSGSTVTLTLAPAVAPGNTVTVRYLVTSTSLAARIKDAAGNQAVEFFSGEVTNNTSAPINTPPTGLPSISGAARVGETLTASADGIEDVDGLAGVVFAWQWMANDASGDAEIEGATAATYILTAAEAGKTVKVRVTFTDDGGTEETLVSAATATVPAPLPEVSIAAASSPLTEGDAAVFVLRRSGDTTSALTVAVSVTEAGNVLDGAAPSSVTFAENASEARLRLATEDDDAAEADARVTVTVAAGSGYRVDAGARTVGVDVFNDDEAPSRSTVTLWSGEMEVESYGGWLGALGYALDDNGWSENGVDYAIDHIIYVLDELLVGFTTAPEDVDGLTMHLGEVELALAGAGSGASYAWSDVELGWEAGMTVPLRLTRRTEAPVAGPGVSVADARVREAEGASLKFRVTLDTPQTSTVSVRYATSDGTAVAGEDYTSVSGALRFAPGQTAKTVEVAVFDDAHDEGAETLALTLSRPFGTQLSHAQATGTIANTDPMPRAWLARFGRTVAEHVVEAVDERLTAPHEAQSQVTIAGRRVDLEGNAREWDAAEARAARDALGTLSGRRRGDVEGRDGFGDSIFARDGAGSGTSRTLTARELLTQSAFRFASEGSGAEGQWTMWGRGAWSGFSGRDDDLSLDGDVATGMVGADFRRDDWLGGLMLSHSEGSGTYTTDGSGSSGRSEGEIDSSLTGLYPYLGFELTERVSVWGVGGYGRGALTLTREGEAPLETDIDMTMAAAGMRGDVLDAGETGGFGLALESDALFVRTTSNAIPGLAAAEADVSRLRLGLEGSYELALDGGGTLVPSLEAGVRHDGGDAETGLGMELGGGLRYEDPSRGLSSEFNLRGLVAHEDGSYEEWGASGSLRYDPGGSTDLGPSLTLAQSWGAPSTGGMESLLGRHTMAGIAAEDAYTPGARLDAELGYGLSVLDGRGVAIPHLGVSRGGDGRTLRLGNRLRFGNTSEVSVEGEFPDDGRTVRLGYRYGFGRSFDFSVEAERRASGAGDGAREHGLWLRASLLW